MKKTIKIAALAATVIATATTSIPFTVHAAEPTVASKYTADQQAAIKTIFNAAEYAEMNPDVAAAFGTDENKLFEHYLVFGINEDRSPSKSFDVNAYASSYPDLQIAFGDNVDSYILHYATFGQKENRTLTTIDAATNSGYSVYPVACFKTGVKGVTGVSLLSGGGALKLTDRQPASSSSDSAPVVKKGYFTITLNGESESYPFAEGQTFGEYFKKYEKEFEHTIDSDNTIKLGSYYMYNPNTKKLITTTDVIINGMKLELTKNKPTSATSISFKIEEISYSDATEGQTWAQYIQKSSVKWNTYGDYVKDSTTSKYLAKKDSTELIPCSATIEKDGAYQWIEKTVFSISTPDGENYNSKYYVADTNETWNDIFANDNTVKFEASDSVCTKTINDKQLYLIDASDNKCTKDGKPSDGATYTWEEGKDQPKP